MIKLLSDREKLVSVYGFTKYYSDKNIPFDFQNYIKKFDDGIFYWSFSEKELESRSKDTQKFLDTVIEKIKRKSKTGDKK